jgi:hypothetical protein
MRTFIIASSNINTVFTSEKQAKASDAIAAESSTTQDEMTKLTAAWPGGCLVEIWSSLKGVVGKKMRLGLESSKRENGKRLYQIAS